MRLTEPLRLGLIGLLTVLLQLALYLQLPQWRAGLDFYVVFLLLLTATRGSALGCGYAIAGGLLLDAYSGAYCGFHTVYYLLPVAIGSLLRAQMLVQYRFLGASTISLLILGKVIAQLVVALVLGGLDSPAYLFRLNYWSLVLMFVFIYASWGWLVRIFPTPPEVRRLGR
jgi:rod shape-determining protein MreD